MFELSAQEVKCSSASTNQENKGRSPDKRLGMSLSFEFFGPNTLLDKIHPELRLFIYKAAADGRQVDMTNHTPDMRFDKFPALPWPYVGSGYSLTIHADLDCSAELTLEDCKVDKFVLTAQDKGIVGYKFRVYCHPENDADIGRLAKIDKLKVKITLTPPGIGEEQQKAA